MGKFVQKFKDIVSLSNYIDIESACNNIKSSIEFRGPNVWILAFAIIIASVGLNVNSIPVIIGAMLISPLMCPIIGLGLGLGTNDTSLLKQSLKNLGIMVLISIIASSLYFLVSPLEMENPTELLARTRPTIYDVLIALFGGMAGIIETTRKEKGTVMSGVAIATALMPPLCTVGYGIASLHLKYALGALYLFFINSVFIALATYVTAKYLKFPVVQMTDIKKQKRMKRQVAGVIIIMIIPSILTAISVIEENNFRHDAVKFVNENKSIAQSYIYDYTIDREKNKNFVQIRLAGEPLTETEKAMLIKSAEQYGIDNSQINIIENGTVREDLSENELIQNILDRNDASVRERDSLIISLQTELDCYKSKYINSQQIAKELIAQYPDLKSFSIARGESVKIEDLGSSENILVYVSFSNSYDKETLVKIENWLKVRLESENITVVQQ